MDPVSYARLAAADPVHEVPTSWGTKLRTGGLAVILLRAGLKIDKLAFARAGKVVLRLALFPMLFEALVNTGRYYWLVVPSFPILSNVDYCLVVSKRSNSNSLASQRVVSLYSCDMDTVFGMLGMHWSPWCIYAVATKAVMQYVFSACCSALLRVVSVYSHDFRLLSHAAISFLCMKRDKTA